MAVTASLHEALQNAICIISPCMLILISVGVLTFDDVIHITVTLLALGMQSVSLDTCIKMTMKRLGFVYNSDLIIYYIAKSTKYIIYNELI